jgi:hypothetical protein
MSIALYIIAGWITLGAILNITTIGKERKPTTPATAAVVVVVDAAFIVALILAAGRLS